jgi:hypothetical protein
LRANNTGIINHEFKWRQVWEMALEPKTVLFLAMTLLVNIGKAIHSPCFEAWAVC